MPKSKTKSWWWSCCCGDIGMGKGKGNHVKMRCGCKSGSMGFGYFLGSLGALIYFLQTTTGFWPSVLAILKAIVWPVFVVMKILGL